MVITYKQLKFQLQPFTGLDLDLNIILQFVHPFGSNGTKLTIHCSKLPLVLLGSYYMYMLDTYL